MDENATNRMNFKDRLSDLYREVFGTKPEGIDTLRPDGSNRGIYRLIGTPTVIGVHGPDQAENRAFISFASSLRSIVGNVPEVFGFHEEHGVYLQEDLGDTTLFDALCRSREENDGELGADVRALYRRVLTLLPRLQCEGEREIDFDLAFPRSSFDHRAIMWDLHYFKYLFLKLVDVPFSEDRLEDDLEQLAEAILEEHDLGFMYRDFQSRNIMVREGETGEAEPWFIDFQGGRRGPLGYDLASLLYDAKANLSGEFREELLGDYLASLGEIRTVETRRFRERFPLFILVRGLQAMGAYGYRGLYQGKEHFVASIPYGVANLARIFSEGLPVDLPELRRVVLSLQEIYPPSVRSAESESKKKTPLTVTLRSFGFPRGSYPNESGPHGGGHVFDCRALNNPGRYEPYRELTGQDSPVIEFLASMPEVELFFDHVSSIVDASVDRYLEREFDSLAVSFGCTGGQHRSVYMAERLAKHLASRGDERIRLLLEHRESGNWPGAGE